MRAAHRQPMSELRREERSIPIDLYGRFKPALSPAINAVKGGQSSDTVDPDSIAAVVEK